MDFIRKIPGFRSGTRWKQIVATLFYVGIIAAIVIPRDSEHTSTTGTVPSEISGTSETAQEPEPRESVKSLGMTSNVFLQAWNNANDALGHSFSLPDDAIPNNGRFRHNFAEYLTLRGQVDGETGLITEVSVVVESGNHTNHNPIAPEDAAAARKILLHIFDPAMDSDEASDFVSRIVFPARQHLLGLTDEKPVPVEHNGFLFVGSTSGTRNNYLEYFTVKPLGD